MASQKQTEANRLNARKSTGPRSSEGKSRSSLNALKSGIDAKSQVIRGESPADLEALKWEYYDRFSPTTPEQRMLVDTLIDAEWLLRRFRVCEAQLWEQGAKTAIRPNPETEIGQAFYNSADHFSRLQRRIDTAHRNYRNALHELKQLQAEQAHGTGPEPVPQPSRKPSRNQSAEPPNGFVPHPGAENTVDDSGNPPPPPSDTLVNRERTAPR